MSLKLCFNSDIHRVSKLPVNFNALIQYSQALFSSKLPVTWGLEYIDEDNDRIQIASDTDFQSVLDDINKGKNVKVFIVEKHDHDSDVENFEEIIDGQNKTPVSANDKQAEPVKLLEEVKLPDIALQAQPTQTTRSE
jgi:hypothetical protein